MDLVKLGKRLMISGGIAFFLFVILGFSTFSMNLSLKTASLISQIGNFLITLGFGLLMIGAILYDVFKKRMKTK
ncbi:hypothetical protein AYK24_06855 [Thermoplasmatales archaeon SG8-52-4]|nr:MAG: hypothetical protein AYK24_06855 [Thermoplasmatales archaeon SG8-52-4]